MNKIIDGPVAREENRFSAPIQEGTLEGRTVFHVSTDYFKKSDVRAGFGAEGILEGINTLVALVAIAAIVASIALLAATGFGVAFFTGSLLTGCLAAGGVGLGLAASAVFGKCVCR